MKIVIKNIFNRTDKTNFMLFIQGLVFNSIVLVLFLSFFLCFFLYFFNNKFHAGAFSLAGYQQYKQQVLYNINYYSSDFSYACKLLLNSMGNVKTGLVLYNKLICKLLIGIIVFLIVYIYGFVLCLRKFRKIVQSSNHLCAVNLLHKSILRIFYLGIIFCGVYLILCFSILYKFVLFRKECISEFYLFYSKYILEIHKPFVFSELSYIKCFNAIDNYQNNLLRLAINQHDSFINILGILIIFAIIMILFSCYLKQLICCESN